MHLASKCRVSGPISYLEPSETRYFWGLSGGFSQIDGGFGHAFNAYRGGAAGAATVQFTMVGAEAPTGQKPLNLAL
jgi:hypothetical protein